MKKEQKESRRKKCSVSRRQIENLQRAWQKTFGRMIEVPKEITQEEMDELFLTNFPQKFSFLKRVKGLAQR
ncbi:TPA: hypothetical protein ACQUHP_005286 [Bacillus cereus]